MAESSAAGGNDDGGAAPDTRTALQTVQDYVAALPDDDDDTRAAKAAMTALTTKPKMTAKVSKGGTLRFLSQLNPRLIRGTSQGIPWLISGI